MSVLKWISLCLLVLVIASCTSIHSLKRYPDKNCQELYLMFQDTAHWKYGQNKKLYQCSDELRKSVHAQQQYNLYGRGTSEQFEGIETKGCLIGLSVEEVKSLLGSPTDSSFNKLNQWIIFNYNLVFDSKDKQIKSQWLIFYFNAYHKRLSIVTFATGTDEG